MHRGVLSPCRWLPRWILASLAVVQLMPTTDCGAEQSSVRWWLTTTDLKHELAEQPPIAFEDRPANLTDEDQVVVDDTKSYQTMFGMGTSLEHATCFNLSQLSEESREQVLLRLFHPEEGIGINLARVCIGTPDFTREAWYSYDDMPPGEQDPQLEHFSIEKDEKYILPVLRAARGVNPELRFFASAWSPPGWMKSTGDMIGGRLLPEHYASYAAYLVRFVEAYQDAGVPIHALTVQNEPGVDRSKDAPRWRYPSCRWTGAEERDFIKGHLGPAVVAAGLETEIWTYDHNFNEQPTADGDDPGIAYPRTVLSDPEAARYVAGVAFHGYAGSPSGMSAFHQEFPRIPIHFTEGSVFGPLGGRRLIDYLRNWAASYNGWVTFLDTQGKPNNGPFRASRTCVTVDPATRDVSYHYDYFQYGHFFRFIKRGAVRIDTTSNKTGIASVAFRNPDGGIVFMTVNTGRERKFAIIWRNQRLPVTLPGQSVATVAWRDDGITAGAQ